MIELSISPKLAVIVAAVLVAAGLLLLKEHAFIIPIFVFPQLSAPPHRARTRRRAEAPSAPTPDSHSGRFTFSRGRADYIGKGTTKTKPRSCG
jgi:hypothetical protein